MATIKDIRHRTGYSRNTILYHRKKLDVGTLKEWRDGKFKRQHYEFSKEEEQQILASLRFDPKIQDVWKQGEERIDFIIQEDDALIRDPCISLKLAEARSGAQSGTWWRRIKEERAVGYWYENAWWLPTTVYEDWTFCTTLLHQAAEQVGLTKRTIQNYHDKGLINPPHLPDGTRVFPEEIIEEIKQVHHYYQHSEELERQARKDTLAGIDTVATRMAPQELEELSLEDRLYARTPCPEIDTFAEAVKTGLNEMRPEHQRAYNATLLRPQDVLDILNALERLTDSDAERLMIYATAFEA